MTALDRAFIKAYASHHSDTADRGTSSPVEPEALRRVAARTGKKLRIDASHVTPVAPPVEQAQTMIASPAALSVSVMPASQINDKDGAAHSVVAPQREELNVDWIWQRVPHPHFTADPPRRRLAEPTARPKDPAPRDSTIEVPKLLAPALPKAAPTGMAPLSNFVTTLTKDEPLRALLEVDRFLWPIECEQLSARRGEEIDELASQLHGAGGEAGRRIALVGLTSTVGTSTVALALVRQAAKLGHAWVLVDGNLHAPQLADRLGLVDLPGWQEVVLGQQRLAEVLVQGKEDGVTLLPLGPSGIQPGQVTANFRGTVLFNMLAEAFELVLVDLGPADQDPSGRVVAVAQTARLDAVYIVYDARHSGRHEVTALAQRLRSAGMHVAGAIANFVSPNISNEPEFETVT